LDPNVITIPMVELKVNHSLAAFENFDQTFGGDQDSEGDAIDSWELIGREEFDFEIQFLKI
jgi:hypothetical protein